jgi:trk system potassium uptake protein TrkH
MGIALFATLIIFISISYNSGQASHTNFRDSLFQSVSILTTTGFGTADYETWAYLAQILLFIMMFVGAMGGSTGGGMKLIRVYVILRYVVTETRRLLHARAIIPIRIGNRTISEDVIRNTLGFFLFYVAIFCLTAVLLTTMQLDIQSAIGAAASALGNIGPALGQFGPTDNYALLPAAGKWLLAFVMMLGRLEIFTIMVIFSRTFWK